MCECDNRENTKVFLFFNERKYKNLKWDKIDVRCIRVFIIKCNYTRKRVLKELWRGANSSTQKLINKTRPNPGSTTLSQARVLAFKIRLMLSQAKLDVVQHDP